MFVHQGSWAPSCLMQFKREEVMRKAADTMLAALSNNSPVNARALSYAFARKNSRPTFYLVLETSTSMTVAVIDSKQDCFRAPWVSPRRKCRRQGQGSSREKGYFACFALPVHERGSKMSAGIRYLWIWFWFGRSSVCSEARGALDRLKQCSCILF